MSAESKRFAWERALLAEDKRVIPSTARLVGLTLATKVDPDLTIPVAYSPSLARIASDTGLGKTAVTDHLNLLEREGWVVRDRPATEGAIRSHERTRYRLTLPHPVREADSPPVREADRVGAPDGTLSGRRTGGSPGGGQDPVRDADTTSTSSISSSISVVSPSVTREEDDVMDGEAATEQEANFVPPALEEGEALPGMFKRALLQPVAEEFKDWTPDRPLAEAYRKAWRDVKAQADEKDSKVRVVHIDYAIHYARTQATIGLTAPNVALSKDPAVHFATATSTARREATNALAKPIPSRPLPDPEPRERFREVNPF